MEETEYCKKKTAEPSAKKRSRRRGRREERELERKRKRTATNWREVKRWTGVWPLTSGSDSANKRSW